jgi:hypothetical protein
LVPESQTVSYPAENRYACEICGLTNHVTRECRRLLYEICGLNCHCHLAYEKCLPWHMGPELRQKTKRFFYTDGSIDPRAAREKDRMLGLLGKINLL